MRAHGFTLVELLLAAAILALVAGTVVVAVSSSGDARKLEMGTSEVVAALRFARSEALRTRQPHGARLTVADDRIRVYRLDTSAPPPVEQYDVRHPLDKRLYDLKFDQDPLTRGVDLSVAQFQYAGDGVPRASIAFSKEGRPVSPLDLRPMGLGVVHVQHAGGQRIVSVQALTGRVTVQ